MTSPSGEPGVPFGAANGPGPHPDAASSPGASRDADYLHGLSNLPTPARLTVGVVSAGRVGTALAEALEKAGHVVVAAVARSAESRRRVADRLPDTDILELAAVVSRAELLIISVPDAALSGVVAEIAGSGELRAGTLVAHTAGAHGVAVLEPLAALGALPLAMHPAMTFVGTAEDTARLPHACFGVTAADEVGDAIVSALVLEMGGEPVRIAEADRTLYHAALAHGANHLVALVSDALVLLNAAIDQSGRTAATVDGNSAMLAERVLGPLVSASLQNVLELGPRALTGPVARGDAPAVARHLEAVRGVRIGRGPHGIGDAYRTMARRAAAYTDAPQELLNLLEVR